MSLEERTSSRFINFTERSYVNNGILTTAKQQGVMLFGTPMKGLNYGLAMVNGYGQNVDMADADDDGFKYIAHVDADLATMNKWKNKVFHVGFNYATQDNADISLLTSGSQSTLGKGQSFFALVDPTGELDTSTFGLEFAGANGPFKVQAEYAKTELDTDANNQDINAYYLEAGWLISGESYADSYKSSSDGGKFDRIKPAQAFNPTNFTGGAWELMAGVSKFDASDVTTTSAGFTRAATDTSEADSWRVGLKFIPDANTRILVNYINTDFDTAINSTTNKNEKALNVRMQYDF
jgi:phosphate-selective porin OprO and OprP